MPSRLSEVSNSELIALCLTSQDKEQAWEEFVRRFHKVILSGVTRAYKSYQDESSPEAVEDLVQEVYRKLIENDYKALRNFRGRHENSIYEYLILVATNVVRDHIRYIRSRKRTVIKISLEDLIRGEDSREASMPPHSTDALSWEGIEDALKKVCKSRQDILIIKLRLLYGFTFDEIVVMLNINMKPSSLNSRVNRIMERLKGELLGSGSRK